MHLPTLLATQLDFFVIIEILWILIDLDKNYVHVMIKTSKYIKIFDVASVIVMQLCLNLVHLPYHSAVGSITTELSN